VFTASWFVRKMYAVAVFGNFKLVCTSFSNVIIVAHSRRCHHLIFSSKSGLLSFPLQSSITAYLIIIDLVVPSSLYIAFRSHTFNRSSSPQKAIYPCVPIMSGRFILASRAYLTTLRKMTLRRLSSFISSSSHSDPSLVDGSLVSISNHVPSSTYA